MIAQGQYKRAALVATFCLSLGQGLAQALDAPGGFYFAADPLVAEARTAEQKQDWLRAAELYGQLAKLHPGSRSFREALLRSWRHARLAQRMEDRGYQRYADQVTASDAQQVLADVLSRLQQTYVDNRLVSIERLYRSGIEELDLAVRDPGFVGRFLPARTTKKLAEFAGFLRARLERPPHKPRELLADVQELAAHASERLGMRPELFLLEFAAGACNGLDEYTSFLTPGVETPAKVDAPQEASVSEPRFLEMGNRIGYLRITRFDAKTVGLLDSGITRLTAAGMRVLVLDLRGNGGGLLSAAVDVADRFITSGVLVTTRGQIREYNRIYKAKGNANVAVPLIVLIDGETASSAELVASAFQDLQRGTLLGQRSFGKGTIQETVRLRGGIGVVITVARFSSPRGQSVDGAGISPDVVVMGSSSEQEMGNDVQLQAALDLARTMGAGTGP